MQTKKIIINPSSPKQVLLNNQLIKGIDQCELFKLINNYNELEDYHIIITKSHKVEISLRSKTNNNDSLLTELVDINNDIELKKISNYANIDSTTAKIDNKILRKILSGLVNYSKSIRAIDKYKEDYEIEKSVLYVLLLPTKIENEYIVKIGYSKDLVKRKSELCKMFGVDDMELIFSIPIKNEGYESHIHNHLKKNYSHFYIETEKAVIKQTENDNKTNKDEKTEKSKFCVETYKFDIILIITIMDILRKELLSTENYAKELENQGKELDNQGKELDNKRIFKQEEEQTKRLQIQEEEQTKREQIALEKERVLLEQLKIKLQLAQLEENKK